MKNKTKPKTKTRKQIAQDLERLADHLQAVTYCFRKTRTNVINNLKEQEAHVGELAKELTNLIRSLSRKTYRGNYYPVGHDFWKQFMAPSDKPSSR